MIDQEKFFTYLRDSGVDFFTGVPDSLLNEFCLYAQENISAEKHIIAANEGNSIGIAAGYHLATGEIPLVYMQNAGLGNALNPLLSLTNQDVYGIPMILLIGWRGDPSVKDWAQHKKQGELTLALLEQADIPYKVVESDKGDGQDYVYWAVRTTRSVGSPVALVARKGMFEKGKSAEDVGVDGRLEMKRGDAIEVIVDTLPEETLYVATTGRATRELYFLRKKRGEDARHDFLNVGAMGHASSISLGIARGCRARLVVCLDGDAAAIMHLGAIPIIGSAKAGNLLHIILNNGAHESVGGQPSVGLSSGFTQIAKIAGYRTVDGPVSTSEQLKQALLAFDGSQGPGFVDVHVDTGLRSKLPPLAVNHQALKDSFQEELTSAPRCRGTV